MSPKLASRGRRYRESAEERENDQRYTVPGAVETLLAMPAAKFEETIELAARLGRH